MSSNILVRNLNLDDLIAVSRVHSSAFPYSALTKLGHEAVRRYYEWQLIGPHEEVVALGLFIDEELVGFCLGGVFPGALTGFLQKHRTFLIQRVLTHPWFLLNSIFLRRLILAIRILRRFIKPKQLTAPPPKKRGLMKYFGILSIAVNLEYQRRGIGKVLMERIETIAKKKGFQKMRLSVHVENQQAVRFYEGIGWEKVLKYGKGTGTTGTMEKKIAS